MKSPEDWFELYGQSHRNPINKLIHWVCIPTIMVSTLGLIQSIPHPFGEQPWFHWGTLAVALCLAFYARLSLTLFLGMGAIAAASLGFNGWLDSVGVSVFWSSLAIFAVSWLFQFIGHKIEGKKPSFFEDLQYLLIGPAWLLQFVYGRLGVPITLEAQQASRG